MPLSNARLAELALRDANAVKMRAERYTWQHIADTLGYASPGHAQERVNATLRQRMKERSDAADVLIEVELQAIDGLIGECMRVLRGAESEFDDPEDVARQMVRNVQEHGFDVADWPANALSYGGDRELVLKAVDRVTKLLERRAKLLGIDRPAQTEGTLTVKIEGMDGDEGP